MGIFDQALLTAERGNPLTATRAGGVIDFFIREHAIVRERDDAAKTAVPREGGPTGRAAGLHRRFGADEEEKEYG